MSRFVSVGLMRPRKLLWIFINCLGSQRKTGEIKQGAVQQMRGSGVHQGAENYLAPARTFRLPSIQNCLYLLALQAILAAA